MTRLRLRRIAALTTTLALLAGLPWLATTLPWPSLGPSLLTWEVHLRSGRLPTGVGIAALIVALWALWGLYLAVLAAEMIGHLRRRPFQMRALRPLQLLAATTLGTLTAPALVHAAPVATTAVVATKEPQGDENEEAQLSEATEPMIVDRNRLIDDFGYDDHTLTDTMAEEVQTTAELITQHGAPELPIVVTGHTDVAGDSDYNLDLSQRRAQAVADALRTHLGEDSVIEVRGEGDRTLLDSADDAEQRRVEIAYSVLVTPPESPAEEQPEPEEGTTQEHTGPAVGLSLPGGLVLAMTALGAGTVAGMALERRNGSLPVIESPAVDEDTEEHNEHTRTGAVSLSPSSETDEDTPTTPGPEMALIDLARGPGLGITGPGGNGAARTLLHRALDEDEAELTVVIPDEELHSLLSSGRRPPLLSENAPVMVTETVEDALTLLQLQVLAQHRAADEAAEHEDEQPQNTDPGPQFVLLTRADPAVAEEVTSLLAHTRGAPLSAVLLGSWPHPNGPTLTLDPTGMITAAEEPLTDLRGHRWATTSADDLERALQNHREAPAPAPEPEEKKPFGPAHGQDEYPAATPTSSKDTAPEPFFGAVSVTVLGPVTLSVHGKQVRPARKTAYEVLAYLAAHPAGARLEAAVDAMWPEETPHRAIRRFHDACTSVRSACRPDLGEAATGIITHEDEVYRLDARMVSCDLWRMDDLLDQAGQADDGAVLTTSAAAMLDGNFAEQADYRWAEAIRVQIRNRIVESLTDHSKESSERRAIPMLRRALKIDPMAGEVAIELAQRYEKKGDKEAARRILKSHEKALESAE